MSRVQFKIEELYKASPAMLYQFITDPATLVRWFCDECDVENGTEYHFTWEGYTEVATLVDSDENELIRFKWDDADDPDEFFEFKMYKAGVNDQTVLEVHDFCDDDEVDDSRELWQKQLQRLRREIGG